jgi:hypothetical protein
VFKRKILVIIMLSLIFVTSFVFGTPVMAADALTAPVLQASNINTLYRLLPISDASKVDTLLARAVVAGTLTHQQARIIRDYWITLQPVFGNNVTLLKNLVNSPNKARVEAYLRYAVGKTMRQVQADKIIQLWTIVHTATRSAATR